MRQKTSVEVAGAVSVNGTERTFNKLMCHVGGHSLARALVMMLLAEHTSLVAHTANTWVMEEKLRVGRATAGAQNMETRTRGSQLTKAKASFT